MRGSLASAALLASAAVSDSRFVREMIRFVWWFYMHFVAVRLGRPLP